MKRALLGIFGALLGLIGLGLLGFAGIVLSVFGTDGTAVVPLGSVSSEKGRAVVVNDFQIEAPTPVPLEEGWLDLQLDVRGDQSHFVAVAPKKDVLKYLQGVPYEVVSSVDSSSGSLKGASIPGDAKPVQPAAQSFWTDQQEGTEVSVAWPVSDTNTTLVVMNQDTSPGVDAQVDVSVGVSWATPAAIAAGVAGLVAIGLAIWMLAAAMKPKPDEFDWAAPGAEQG